MSERSEACEKIAAFIRDNDMCRVFGGDVHLSKSGRPHYATGFSLPRILDGTVQVYSTSYIILRYRTAIRSLPSEFSDKFTSVDAVIDYLRTAFVDRNYEAIT